ncbi:unnamed protein product, partial [Brachionus calyciflorus]
HFSLYDVKSKNYHELNPKDLVLLNVIFSLLRTYWPGNDEIIDISCKNTNRISKLYLYGEKVENIEKDDFDCNGHIMNRENIEKCCLSFESFISKEMINNFKFVKELTLDFKNIADVDYELFSDFEDLQTLFLYSMYIKMSSLPSDWFVGLENLKKLILIVDSISSFEPGEFSKLLNLECLQ